MNLQYEEVMDDDLLYTMLEELGSVSSVYYRPAEEFIHPQTGPSPVQTNSPIPDEELDLMENNNDDNNSDDSDSSDSSDSSDDIDIFADEEKEPNTQSDEESDQNQSDEDDIKERDSFDDIFN